MSAHKAAADDIDLALDHGSSELAAQTLGMMESKTPNIQPKLPKSICLKSQQHSS